jgi:hypothetical protein
MYSQGMEKAYCIQANVYRNKKFKPSNLVQLHKQVDFFENQIIINCCSLSIYCPFQRLGLELIWSSNFFHKTINVHFFSTIDSLLWSLCLLLLVYSLIDFCYYIWRISNLISIYGHVTMCLHQKLRHFKKLLVIIIEGICEGLIGGHSKFFLVIVLEASNCCLKIVIIFPPHMFVILLTFVVYTNKNYDLM